MAKLLNTTLLVTMSQATPEGLGYGNIYASSSKLYFTSSLGLFDLTDSKGYIIVREYVTGASVIWNVPGNVKYVRILAVGGGGGGGGGAKRAGSTPAANSTTGATGAAGGPIVMHTFPADHFTRPSYTVTVGGGGNAGLGNTNALGGAGTSGTNGGTTSLASGSFIIIRAGVTGVAENNRGVAGLDNDTFNVGGLCNGDGCTPSTTPSVIPSWYGGHWSNLISGFACGPTYIGNAATPTVGTFTHAMNGQRGTGAGGAGGGIRNTTTTSNGASGSGVIVNGVILGTGSPGLSATGNAGSDGVTDLLDIMNLFYFSGSNSVTSSYGLGSAGCGGGSGNLTGTIGGGKGGDGADIGAGGAGGGSSTGSANAGNGGTGGDGYMAIIEYY
jgi:hypothetical protein